MKAQLVSSFAPPREKVWETSSLEAGKKTNNTYALSTVD